MASLGRCVRHYREIRMDVEVNIDIDLYCDECGKELNAAVGRDPKSSWYKKILVSPCPCRTEGENDD